MAMTRRKVSAFGKLQILRLLCESWSTSLLMKEGFFESFPGMVPWVVEATFDLLIQPFDLTRDLRHASTG